MLALYKFPDHRYVKNRSKLNEIIYFLRVDVYGQRKFCARQFSYNGSTRTESLNTLVLVKLNVKHRNAAYTDLVKLGHQIQTPAILMVCQTKSFPKEDGGRACTENSPGT